MRNIYCVTCKQPNHDFAKEDASQCVPPSWVFQFGQHRLSGAYRAALFAVFPHYTVEEIVGSYLGRNPLFPSQFQWEREQREASTSAKESSGDSSGGSSGDSSGDSSGESCSE